MAFPSEISSSFLSSISVLTMRLLQDSSRPLCFWSLHQSWLSRCFYLSDLPWHCPSRSSSVSLCFSFPPHVHVKLHLVIFSPPSFLRVQTTAVSFSWSFVPLFLQPQALLLFVHFWLFFLLLPIILLSQLISATNSLRSSSFLRLRHSELYSKWTNCAVG